MTDLAWLRLEPWREAIASVFDPPPVAAALADLAAVDVDGPINEARLLAGWLGSRLERQVALTHSERPHVERVALTCGQSEFVVERHTRVQVGRAYGTGVSEHAVVLPLLDASRCSWAAPSTCTAQTPCSPRRSRRRLGPAS